MSAPPKPYKLETVTAPASGGFHLYVVDANGRKIAALWGKEEEKMAFGNEIVEMSERENA